MMFPINKMAFLSAVLTGFFMVHISTGEAATLIVENANDTGNGSLRQAIIDANTNPGEDFIAFNIPTNGPHTIALQSALPEIVEAVTLDGFTQGNQTANPADDAIPNSNPIDQPINAIYKIEIDGLNAGFSTSGFLISGSDTTIRGLVINRFRLNGILIQGGENVAIEGNFIGTDISGTMGLGNGEDGINLSAAQNCRIGGSDAAQRNLISDNDDGIDIQDSSSGNQVGGNFIGTDSAGSSALGNSQQGVKIDNSTDNLIGGTVAALRNLISGNSQQGLGLLGGASGNIVQGNYIGPNRTGNAPLLNRGEGIQIEDSPDNLIGGTESTTPGQGCNGACNLICGNLQEGIAIDGESAIENRISGNFIGTDQSGTADLGNGFDGILIASGGNGTFIGGVSPEAGNLIAHNAQDGIALGADAGNGISILGNSISDNGTLGIDLNNNGVTDNDPGPPPDIDNGPNGLQNSPELTSVSVQTGEIRIEGTLQSSPNADFRIEFFANAECDPTLHGEGERFLGFLIVSTDGQGLSNFVATLPAEVAAEAFVTSTATVIDGPTSHADTSEFSECFQVKTCCACPSPIPDFVDNGRVDVTDLIALRVAHRDQDIDLDLTEDSLMSGEDFFQFSRCWYHAEMP